MILGLDNVGPIVSDNAPTMCADHTGTDPNWFPSSGIWSSGDRHAPSQRKLEYKEILVHASNDKGTLDSSALYPPHEVAHGSLSTQHGYLEELRDYLQLSLESINRHTTVPISNSTTSSRQPISERTGRYSCKLCGDRFVQPQGARRHHREKHEPGQCPHCHTFRWGRLYLFKKHLKMEHPEIDPEATILDATRRNRRKGTIPSGDQALPHVPLSDFTLVRCRFDDTKYPTTSSPPAQSKCSPASPPLDSQAKTLDIDGEDARAGALRLSLRVGTSLR